MVEEKGLMDMVEALAHCDPGMQLLFVGAGEFRASLEERVRELGNSEQVRFMPAQPLEKLPQVMNALDVLSAAVAHHGQLERAVGRVIIEAHACATPVIGSSSGAIPTWSARAA
jgi:glycosyltransferase involved in cell wall biosynthesis